jgi:hypothetical protein
VSLSVLCLCEFFDGVGIGSVCGEDTEEEVSKCYQDPISHIFL